MLSISVLNLNITGKLYIPYEKDKKRNTIKQAIIVYVSESWKPLQRIH